MNNITCISRPKPNTAVYHDGASYLLCEHVLMNKPYNNYTQQHMLTRVTWCDQWGRKQGDSADVPTSSHREAVCYAWELEEVEMCYNV